jgi:hypothetical protein
VSEGGIEGGAARRRTATVWATASLTAFAFLCAGQASAQAEDEGQFEVLERELELVDGVYRVSGRIYLRLPSDAAMTLQSTVPLTIRVEVQFLNRLWFWWDNAEFERILRYRLSYNSTANRYVVEMEPPEEGEMEFSFGTDEGYYERETFQTLRAALDYIGQIDSLAVARASELDRNLRYDIRIRAVLDQGGLPGPIRLLAFWRPDWSISSEWLSWRLDEE